MKWRAWAVFALLGVLWGSAWILTPVTSAPKLLAGAVRFAIAAAVLGLLALFGLIRRIPQHQAFPLTPSIVLGVTMIGLPYALAVWARGAVSQGMVPVFYAAMPLAALFFSRKADGATIPAMAIGMGGVACLTGQAINFSSGQIYGMLLLGAAVLLGAFSLNYGKASIRPGSFLLSSAIQCAVASVLLVCLSGASGQLHAASWLAFRNRQSSVQLIALAVAESGIGLPLLYWLIARIESWQAATLQWMVTLAAVAEAAWVLRARPTLEMSAGAVAVLGAVLWVMRQGSGPETVTLQITSKLQSRLDASNSK
jgi:drug/metabolite transporter (DMT)-like permease